MRRVKLLSIARGRRLQDSVKPIMCCYKVVRVKFEVWGLQTRVEAYTHRVSEGRTSTISSNSLANETSEFQVGKYKEKDPFGQSMVSHGRTSSFQNPVKSGEDGKIVNKRQEIFNINMVCKAIENNMAVLPAITGTRMLGLSGSDHYYILI